MGKEKWIQEFRDKRESDKKTILDISDKINELLKGIDRVSCLPTILSNVFESIEVKSGSDEIHGFKNQMVKWGIETYASKKINIVIPRLRILHNYCIEMGFSINDKWEWGSGDRTVCYIDAKDKEVLLFENQNIKFVVVFDNYKFHVREVFESLIDNDEQYFYSFRGASFDSVSKLREGLKSDKGLEIAICNLTDRFSDVVDGNDYPDRIDLSTMIAHNFSDKCRAFRYGDSRDKGYLMSINNSFKELGNKCEMLDVNRANYAFDDMSGATFEMPKSYIKCIERDNKLKDLGID